MAARGRAAPIRGRGEERDPREADQQRRKHLNVFYHTAVMPLTRIRKTGACG
jgi:hypothetical protein